MPHKKNQFQGNTNERYPILYMPCHLDHGTSVFHLYKCNYCEKHSPTVYTGGLHVGYKHWDKKEKFDKK